MKTVSFVFAAVLSLAAAQQAARFEVASVRQNSSAPQAGFEGAAIVGIFPHGDVRITNADLFSIILQAHGIDLGDAGWGLDFERFRTPDSILGKKFDIEGKGGSGDGREKLRTLLVERFGLKTHMETRTIPMYAATLKEPGRLGPYLKPSTINCSRLFSEGVFKEKGRPRECTSTFEQRFGARIERNAGTLEELLKQARLYLRTPIVDRTGLTGDYEWEVAIPRDGAGVIEAFEDQMGIRLEKTTGPWEVVVVDEVKMPTPN